MTLRDYYQVLRRQIVLILIVAIAGIALGAGYYLLVPKKYTSVTSLYVVSQGENSTSAAYQGAQLSEQRVVSYVELATSDRVAQEVVNQLGLAETSAKLRQRVEATSTLNSVLISISATDSSPSQAALIANTFGQKLTEVVNEIERPIAPGEPQLITIRTVQPAPIPSQASSTGLLTLLGLAAIGGLILGVAIAFLRHYFDTTIRTVESLREVSGVPVLGSVPYGAQISESPLYAHRSPQSRHAEAVRQIRTNLQFIDVDTSRKALVVTSCVAGEGKTVTTVNLALACSSAGLSVLLIEADLRRPHAAELLGLDNAVGLTSVLTNRATLDQAIQRWDAGLDVLGSGPIPPNPSELLSSKYMADIQKHLTFKYDLVLIDTPPVLPVSDATAIASMADGVLLICRHGSTTRNEVSTAVESFNVLSIPIVGSVLSMAPDLSSSTYYDTTEGRK